MCTQRFFLKSVFVALLFLTACCKTDRQKNKQTKEKKKKKTQITTKPKNQKKKKKKNTKDTNLFNQT